MIYAIELTDKINLYILNFIHNYEIDRIFKDNYPVKDQIPQMWKKNIQRQFSLTICTHAFESKNIIFSVIVKLLK